MIEIQINQNTKTPRCRKCNKAATDVPVIMAGAMLSCYDCRFPMFDLELLDISASHSHSFCDDVRQRVEAKASPDEIKAFEASQVVEGDRDDMLPYDCIEAEGTRGRELRTFGMKAYNGGPMQLFGPQMPPLVVDLAGMVVPTRPIPAFHLHNQDRIVGHSNKVGKGISSVSVLGIVSGANRHAREIVASADNGFPWQVSIGAAFVGKMLPKGKSASVNGKTVYGPAIVAVRSALFEASFVAIGADNTTSARISK